MVGRLAPNLHWMAATPPLCRFLGVEHNDLVAHSFLDFVHPADAPALRDTLREALKDGEGHNITFRIVAPNTAPTANNKPAELAAAPSSGRVAATGRAGAAAPRARHVQMDVMTCYTNSGAPLHLRCHFLDVTEHVLTERTLCRRTEELIGADARLREINADLQRLKESYREVAHDLQTKAEELEQANTGLRRIEPGAGGVHLRRLARPQGAAAHPPGVQQLPGRRLWLTAGQ